MVDYWAHRHADDPELRKEEYDPDFDEACKEMGEEELHDFPPDLDDFETVSDDNLG